MNQVGCCGIDGENGVLVFQTSAIKVPNGSVSGFKFEIAVSDQLIERISSAFSAACLNRACTSALHNGTWLPISCFTRLETLELYIQSMKWLEQRLKQEETRIAGKTKGCYATWGGGLLRIEQISEIRADMQRALKGLNPSPEEVSAATASTFVGAIDLRSARAAASTSAGAAASSSAGAAASPSAGAAASPSAGAAALTSSAGAAALTSSAGAAALTSAGAAASPSAGAAASPSAGGRASSALGRVASGLRRRASSVPRAVCQVVSAFFNQQKERTARQREMDALLESETDGERFPI